jgi:hypothetical protein
MRPAINTQNPGPYKPTRGSHPPKILSKEELEAAKIAKEAKKAKKEARRLEYILKEKNEALKQEISEINSILKPLQLEVGTVQQLPESYANIKAQSWSFFKDPAREEGAKFIASIATSLNGNLSAIEPEKISTEQAEQFATSAKLTMNGACLYILQSIKSSYDHGWFYKDPNNSALFRLLSPRVADKSLDEQKLALEELKVFLETENHKNVSFGQNGKDQTLLEIQSQIDLLSAGPKLHS